MKRVIQFTLLILLSATAARAEDRGVKIDPFFWKNLTPPEKLYWMVGYEAGFTHGFYAAVATLEPETTKAKPEATAPGSPAGIPFGTLVAGVDKCYEDLRNDSVDIEYCTEWAIQGVRGRSDDKREEYLAYIRKISSPTQ
jgi:hypothetical protein